MVALLFDVLDFGLLSGLHIVKGLLSSPLRFCYLVLQLQHKLHVFGVFVGEGLHEYLPLLNLAFKLLDQAEVVPADAQDFLLLVLNHLLQLVNVTSEKLSGEVPYLDRGTIGSYWLIFY